MLGIPQGISVQEIEEGSAAEKAGMMKYDIIVKFDGQKVSTGEKLTETVGYYRAGETVTVTVQRLVNGAYETIDLELTLGSREQ